MSKIYLLCGSQGPTQWALRAFDDLDQAEEYLAEMVAMLDMLDSRDDLKTFQDFYDPNVTNSPQEIKYYIEEMERE